MKEKFKRNKAPTTMLALTMFSRYSVNESVKIEYEHCKYKGMTNKELGTKRKKKRRQRIGTKRKKKRRQRR